MVSPSNPKRVFPQSRKAADQLRPKKRPSNSSKAKADLFTQNNPIPQPPREGTVALDHQTNANRKYWGSVERNNNETCGFRQSGNFESSRRAVKKEEEVSLDEYDGMGRKRIRHAKALSTFHELKMAVAAVQERLEGLCEINPAWESQDKLDIRQQVAGLRKDTAGNWRDVDSMVIEATSTENVKERMETQHSIDGIFKSLSTTEADIKQTLGRFERDLGLYSSETDNMIGELYPDLVRDVESKYGQRERFEQTGSSDVSSISSAADLGLDKELGDLTKPTYLRFRIQQQKTKEETTLHKIHNRIQEYGLEEVAKVHRDERFHIKKHHQADTDGEEGAEEGVTPGAPAAAIPASMRASSAEMSRKVSKMKQKQQVILSENDAKVFQLQVKLAMLKGQFTEKTELVESQRGKAGEARSQEELEKLFIKAGEMKIKSLLEVIDKQQDQLSTINQNYDKMDAAVQANEEKLNKKIQELSSRSSGGGVSVGATNAAQIAEAANKEKKEKKVLKARKNKNKDKGKEKDEEEEEKARRKSLQKKQKKEMDKKIAAHHPEQHMNAISEDHEESSSSSSESSLDSSSSEEKEGGPDDRRGELQAAMKKYLVKNQEETMKERAAENSKLQNENQIMLEQLERISNTASGAKSYTENISELDDEIGKVTRIGKIKKNRLKRLEAAHEEKQFNVKNAREIAIKAQKERVEKEIKDMRKNVEVLDGKKQFARFCREILIISRNMKKDEEDKNVVGGGEGDSDDKDEDDSKGDDDNDDGDDDDEIEKSLRAKNRAEALENRLLHIANSIVSQDNINRELESTIISYNLAKLNVEKNDKAAKELFEKLERVEDCQIIDEGGEGAEQEEQEEDEASKNNPRRTRKKKIEKLAIFTDERDAAIETIKKDVSVVAARRVKAMKKMSKLRESILTLSSLKAEGRKRLHKDKVNSGDIGKFQELAGKMREMAKAMSGVVELLSSDLMTRKRNNYIKAKQGKLKKLLDDDPNAQKSGLAGMMNKVADEKQMKEMSEQLKEEVKSLDKAVKKLTPKDKKTAAEKMEERNLLRQLRNENSALNKRWEKVEDRGGREMEAYKGNRQVVSLNTSRIEARRKLATLTTKIQRAMGFHDKRMREEEEKRRAKGMGRVITKKEQDLMGSVKILKRQAVWWKRRLAEAMRGEDDSEEKGEPRSPVASPSPKGFVSRLEERMEKRTESKMLRGASVASPSGDGRSMKDALQNIPQGRRVKGGDDDALFIINSLLASDAADTWRNRAASLRKERKSLGGGEGGGEEKKEKEKEEEGETIKETEKEKEGEEVTVEVRKKSGRKSPASPKSMPNKLSDFMSGWGGNGAGDDDGRGIGIAALPLVGKREGVGETQKVTEKKKTPFELMNEMLTRLKEQRMKEEEESKAEGEVPGLFGGLGGVEPKRPEEGKGKMKGSPRKFSFVQAAKEEAPLAQTRLLPADKKGEDMGSAAERLSFTIKGTLDKEKEGRLGERLEQLKGMVGDMDGGSGGGAKLRDKLESEIREGLRSQDEKRKQLFGSGGGEFG